MKHAAIALLAIVAVAIAAWAASLAAARLYPARTAALAAEPFPQHKPGIAYPRTQADCDAHGGVWLTQMGISDAPDCRMETTDAGHACTDSRECEGLCEAPDGVTEGTQLTGRCTDHRPALGCRSLLSKGRVRGICID